MRKLIACFTSFTFILILSGCLFPQVDDLLVEKEIIEIELEESGLEFRNGNYDLGKVVNLPGGNSFDIKIKNRGGEKLEFKGNPPIEISGKDRDNFSIDFSSFSTSLQPGDETYFSLIFEHEKSGKNYCSLTIPNNSYMSPFSMDLCIEGLFSNQIYSSGSAASNDKLTALTYDDEGNIIAGGFGTNLAGTNSKKDWWIKKITPQGAVEWELILDGNGGDDEIACLAMSNTGLIIVAGYGTNLVSGTSKEDWWIRKIDRNGYLMWDKYFDGNFKKDIITAIAVDSMDNIIVGGTGNSLDYVNTQTDWRIIKLDTGGNPVRTHYFDVNAQKDHLKTISVSEDGRIYAAGLTKSPLNGYGIVTAEIDEYGIFEQRASFYYEGYDGNIKLTSDKNGNLYVVGTGVNLLSYSSGPDIWLQKIDNSYDFPINMVLDDNDCNSVTVCSVITDDNENIYLSGYGYNLASSTSGMDWWVKKLDSSASPVWTSKSDICPEETITTLFPTPDDTVLIGGYGRHIAEKNSNNDWILKILSASEGNFE